MEKLIIIAVILGASFIHNWFKRKQEEAEERDAGSRTPGKPPPIPPDRRSRPQAPADWQEELRRLLQGEPAPTLPPPPPVRRPPPRTTEAPPIVRPTPEPAAPRPFLARSAIPVPDTGREMEVGLSVRPVSLDQATAAHERAAHLQSSVVQRMQETTSRVSAHVGAGPAMKRSTSAARMRTLLRQKESQRALILGSIILGPPKALET